MALESVRGYLQLVSGLGEMTRTKATEVAHDLLSLPGADEVGRRAHQASVLADQILEAARANRSGLLSLVRTEVEAALARADLARRTDLDAARTALAALGAEVEELRGAVLAGAAQTPLGRVIPGGRPDLRRTASTPPSTSPPAGTTARKAAPTSSARKATAAKAARTTPTARKATAKRATATKATATKATATKATATKATAKRVTATKATAKKAAQTSPPAKKTPAKKVTGA